MTYLLGVLYRQLIVQILFSPLRLESDPPNASIFRIKLKKRPIYRPKSIRNVCTRAARKSQFKFQATLQ